MRKPTKTNAVLLAVIGVLSIALFTRSDSSSAWAQPGQPTTETPFNAAEQRRQMIAALNQISTRLTTLETKLGGPLSVKVIEMPPVVIKDQVKK